MKRTATLALVLALALPSAPWRAAVVEEVVIKVNDAIITKSEYDKRLKGTIEGMKREYKGPDIEQRLKEVPQKLLEQMEEELLLVEKAKQIYQVDAIVDSQVDQFMKDNRMSTKADLAKALQSEGLTLEEFRKQITLIYVPEFMKSREIRSKISISTDEITSFYEAHKGELSTKPQVQLQEILLLKQRHSPEEAQTIYGEIKAGLAGGKDFGELAAQYSDAFSKGGKGEAGWYSATDLSASISSAVFSLKAGEMTDLVPTNAGWYIFRVKDKKEAQVPTLEQSREQVVEAIKEEKFQKEYRKYIDDIKAQNYVRVNPKYV